MPAFNGGTNHAGIFYGELGDSPAELIKTTFTNPTMVLDRLDNNDALGYARDLLAPFGFTSLLAPLLLVPAVPQFFANILTNLNFFWSIQFHYAAIIVTFVALASVDGVARLRSLPWRRFAVGLVAASALATSVAWGMSPISTQYRNGYWPLAGNARQSELEAAVDAVPSDAAVSATYNIVPHLSHREQIYTFPNPWYPLNWGVAGAAPHDPDHDHVPAEIDWIVVDRTTHVPDGREEVLIDEPARQRRVRGRVRRGGDPRRRASAATGRRIRGELTARQPGRAGWFPGSSGAVARRRDPASPFGQRSRCPLRRSPRTRRPRRSASR